MKSSGTLRFSPELRPGSHRRRDGGSTRWWLILDGDPELGRYLRHQYLIAHRRVRSLQSPLWGTHVSVIRGEEPADPSLWGVGEGERVAFEFDPMPREMQGYVWYPVRCDALLDLRERLGLRREPEPPLHLTIGNG